MDKIFIPLIIIQFITFIALAILFRYLSSRNLKGALERLNSLNEENLIKEEALKKQLELAQAERIAEVEKGKNEAKAIIEKAKKEVEGIKIKLEQEAKKQAEEIIQRAQEESGKFKHDILSEAGKQALDLSVQMIKYTFGTQGKEHLQHQLIDDVIAEIAALSKERFTVSSDKVKVTTAFVLTDTERENIKKTLSEKLNSHVVLEEKTEPDLVTGLILEIGALIIDGSLKTRLTRAMEYLKSDRSWC